MNALGGWVRLWVRSWTGLVALMIVAGCQSVISPGGGGSVPADTRFVSQGKLSLRPQSPVTENRSQVEGFTASYRLTQTGSALELELWGALGQGRTRITGDGQRIKIVDGTGRTVNSRNPERLLRRHLGWSLPLSVLPYWLQAKGAPAPPAQLMRFQANGDLEAMQQLGWTLNFDRYKTITGLNRKQRLPGRIKALSSELKLTIVSREWSL